MNFDYSNRHFKTHDLRKSRLLEFYALGYAKNTIADFATHSSEATTFSYYVSDHGFTTAHEKRSKIASEDKAKLNDIPAKLETDLPYFDQHGNLIYPAR